MPTSGPWFNGQWSQEDLSRLYRVLERPKIVEEVLETLTNREEEVIRLRFFEGKTLQQIGRKLGVTRERIRQIETKAVNKLRHPSRRKFLEPISS